MRLKSRLVQQVIALFIIVLFLVPVVYTRPTIKTEPKQIIMDIDADTSDIPALIYLLKNPTVTVKAVIISCGITYIKDGVRNILQLLDYLGYRNIPVAGGREKPLMGNNTFPESWRNGSLNFYGLTLPNSTLQPSALNGSQLIISEFMNSTTPMSVIATGPLTDLADAIQRKPEIKGKIDKIHIMGGAVLVHGNVGYESSIPNYKAEWNMYIDPYAASIVFSSGIAIQLVTLDATNNVPQTADFQTKLSNVKRTPEADIVYKLYILNVFFWDQLTAVSFTNPEVLTIQKYNISVVVNDPSVEGQTIINNSIANNVEVAVNANATLFENLFLDTINSVESTSTTTTTTSSQITTTTSSTETSKTNKSTPSFDSILVIMALLVIIREKKSHR